MGAPRPEREPGALDIRPVVTCFLRSDSRYLLLKRSEQVRTMRGKWAGVSGSLEPGEEPAERAYREIEEETGLQREEVRLLRRGVPIPALDVKHPDVIWLVCPLLFEAPHSRLQIDWEHVEYRWIEPAELEAFDTVPLLGEVLFSLLDHTETLKANPATLAELEALQRDRTRGSIQLARWALEILRRAAETTDAETAGGLVDYLRALGHALMASRPAMSPLVNSVLPLLLGLHRLKPAAHTSPIDHVRRETSRMAQAAIRAVERAAARAATAAAELIEPGDVVLTHSYSSTVLAAFREAAARGKRFGVIVTESRPLLEGRRVAEELSGLGVPVTLIVDAAAGLFLPEATKVLVGADSLLADGALVNKVGTRLLAAVAREGGKPFLCAAETLKFHLASYMGVGVELEEKPPEEVAGPAELPGLGAIRVRNPYFDVTPAKNVSLYVTERGVFGPERVRREMENLFKEIAELKPVRAETEPEDEPRRG